MATTISQAQHLIDIGIPVESADMVLLHEEPYETSDSKFDGLHQYLCVPFKQYDKGPKTKYRNISYFPAWSLEALLELIPYNVTDNNAVYRFKLVKYPDKWKCYHENFGSSSTGIQEGKTALEAAYNMVVYLKENFDIID